MNSALYLCLMVGLCSLAKSHDYPDYYQMDRKIMLTKMDENGQENNQNLTKVSNAKLPPTVLDFGMKLYKQFASTSPEKNIFFSPLSISATLALLSLGARSITHTQIVEGLGFNLTEILERDIHAGFQSLFYILTHADDQILIDIGQALFVKDDLKLLQIFLHDVNESYTADVSTINFKESDEAKKVINDYVEKKTHGKITELVKSLDPQTAMVIVNYIFFKGTWKRPFNSRKTREENFFVNHETIIQIPMMRQKSYFESYVDAELSCIVVRMDYKSSAAALFILPDEGKFKQVEDSLTGNTINKWINHLHHDLLDLKLPSFTISTTHELKEALNSLGIDIFSDQTDLSGIAACPELKVSTMTHKAVLTVKENGTEAGAATISLAAYSYQPIITFNRPFFIYIFSSSTRTPLFIGKIKNPKES